MPKNRYWTAVCYPENMISGWEEKIGDLLQVPYAYCKHDLDHDSKSEHRKDHVHIVLVFSNTTTDKHALGVVRSLSAKDRVCCPGVQPVYSIRHIYDYLIHDTETCRKAGKELYDKSQRIEGNSFDIGAYEQLSAQDKDEAVKELCADILDAKLYNFADFYQFVLIERNEQKYFEAVKSYSGLFERLIKGVYNRTFADKFRQDAF